MRVAPGIRAVGVATDPGRWPALLFASAIIVAAIAYQPGFGGSLHFDDRANLGGLAQIRDASSAAEFITAGTAGPLGRPLALASFAVQAYAWPDSVEVFLRTNAYLHLLNGALVAWVLYLLSMARGHSQRESAWLASLSASIWMLLPLLASTSLLVVQRMTILSATFVLLGLVGYLYGRRMLLPRPRIALLLMTVSLLAGTTLAALSKENGVLLPLFVLICESTLLRHNRPALTLLWRSWFAVFLLAPALALLGYLLVHATYGESIALTRDFSSADRLLTQTHVLWAYLRQAFIPLSSALGPFHDSQIIYREWLAPASVLAVGAWLALATCAVIYRRKAPTLAFAVGWYLGGHALESTTLPLELYFEHRNYVPLVGPVFALAALSTLCAPAWQLFARGALYAYALLLGVVLFSTTSLWGRPPLAAEMWALQNPDSQRAVHYLSQQLQQAGDSATARRVLRLYLQENESAFARLQLLGLSCSLEPDRPHADLLQALEQRLSTSRFELGVDQSLERLYRMAQDDVCLSMDRQRVYRLAEIAASNRAFQAHGIVHHNLHILMAEEAFAQRSLDLTMHHIESALKAHYALSTLILAAQTLDSAGLQSEAAAFMERARSIRPRNPVQAVLWRARIGNLTAATE